jgi:hypothetical protein
LLETIEEIVPKADEGIPHRGCLLIVVSLGGLVVTLLLRLDVDLGLLLLGLSRDVMLLVFFTVFLRGLSPGIFGWSARVLVHQLLASSLLLMTR